MRGKIRLTAKKFTVLNLQTSLLCLRCKLLRSLKILVVFYPFERSLRRQNQKLQQSFCLLVSCAALTSR